MLFNFSAFALLIVLIISNKYKNNYLKILIFLVKYYAVISTNSEGSF